MGIDREICPLQYANDLQVRLHVVQIVLQDPWAWIGCFVYVCNCNGIRERDVRAAIDRGATRPAEIFRHADCRPQCARCVCDMRCMIDDQVQALRFAAE